MDYQQTKQYTNTQISDVQRQRRMKANLSTFTTHFSREGKQAAFTLAEVLITLGIIGIVAALTLPSVIANYKKQKTVSQLKKVYTILNQAIKLSEAQNGEYESWPSGYDMGAEEYFNTYFKPYFKVMKYCQSGKDCGYKSNYPWKYLDGSDYPLLIAQSGRVPFILSDGTFVMIMTSSGSGTIYRNDAIYVDLNVGKEPNMIGSDIFIFKREPNGKGVFPLCYDSSEAYIKNNCSITDSGCCAAYIMRNGWEIPKDYPVRF